MNGSIVHQAQRVWMWNIHDVHYNQSSKLPAFKRQVYGQGPADRRREVEREYKNSCKLLWNCRLRLAALHLRCAFSDVYRNHFAQQLLLVSAAQEHS